MRGRVDALAIATTRETGDVTGTVKGLGWKILYANHRPSLGPERFEALVQRAGGPTDVKGLDLATDVPVEPFNEALILLDEALGDGDGGHLEAIGVAYVERWATMYRTLVEQMHGRPGRMLEILCAEVHPWMVGPSGRARVIERTEHGATVELEDGLLPAFRRGLVQGFADVVGADATVEATGPATFEVRWPPRETERPARWRIVLDAMRAPFLAATLVPILLGTALAAWQGAFDPLHFAMAAVGAAALHASANMFNDVLDHRRGVDEANLTPTPFAGGSRVIQRELVSWRSMAWAAGLLGAAGSTMGLALAWMTGPSILLLGAIGVTIGYAYTGEPFRLADRGLGELAVFTVFGPLLTAGGYALQTGTVTLPSLVAGVPVGLLMAAVIAVNELPDAPWDARTGKRTLVVRLDDAAPELVAGLSLLPYPVIALLVWLGTLPLGTLVALATLPLAAVVARGVLRARFDAEALVRHQTMALVLHGVTGLLLAAGAAQGVIA